MKRFLALTATVLGLSTIAFANEIEEIQETLEQKVSWAQSEGEKFEAIGDVEEDIHSKELHYQMASNFFRLEKDYLDELHCIKFISQLKREFEDACEGSYSDEDDLTTPQMLRRNVFARFLS